MTFTLNTIVVQHRVRWKMECLWIDKHQSVVGVSTVYGNKQVWKDVSQHVCTMCYEDVCKLIQQSDLQIMQWHKYCYLVHSEHSFQQINEFSPVCLLCKQLPSFKICWHIHLPNVIQTIEDVLPGLFWLNTSFSFMLFWCLIKEKRKRTTSSSTLQPPYKRADCHAPAAFS